MRTAWHASFKDLRIKIPFVGVGYLHQAATIPVRRMTSTATSEGGGAQPGGREATPGKWLLTRYCALHISQRMAATRPAPCR